MEADCKTSTAVSHVPPGLIIWQNRISSEHMQSSNAELLLQTKPSSIIKSSISNIINVLPLKSLGSELFFSRSMLAEYWSIIRMISEGSCDTEDWSNACSNCNNILQYYRLYCIFEQINAVRLLLIFKIPPIPNNNVCICMYVCMYVCVH